MERSGGSAISIEVRSVLNVALDQEYAMLFFALCIIFMLLVNVTLDASIGRLCIIFPSNHLFGGKESPLKKALCNCFLVFKHTYLI